MNETQRQTQSTTTPSGSGASDKPYFIGLDVGTDSCGFAVTDTEYRVCKAHGKRLWGVRLFDEAHTAQERRVFRATRRRYMRRRQRIDLLQDLFADAINPIDPTFFRRLDESFFRESDKKVAGKYSLFNDPNFTDKDFYRRYPTMYHLRAELMRDDAPHDPRLVYLACHHIVKHRGHFLMEGDIGNVDDIDVKALFAALDAAIEDAAEKELMPRLASFRLTSDAQVDRLRSIADDRSLTDAKKAAALADLFGFDKKQKSERLVLELIAGKKVQVTSLFDVEDLSEKTDVELKKGDYADVARGELAQIVGDAIGVLDAAAAIYDWFLLRRLLHGESTVSDSMVSRYDKHARDLRLLKDCVRRYCPDKYDRIFKIKAVAKLTKNADADEEQSKKEKDPRANNYAHYVGVHRVNGHKVYVAKATYDDFIKFLKRELKAVIEDDELLKSDPDVAAIAREIAEKTFLPKAVCKDNGVIPHQLHKAELKKILTNASRYLPRLTDKDAEGLSASDKIVSIMTYRIPYYVGPINAAHTAASGKGYAWIVKRENTRVLPWNIDRVVDHDRCMETFIDRLINYCTYLKPYKVIPAKSLLYSEYCVLAELNQIRIDGKPVDAETKRELIETLFRAKSTVKDKDLRHWLRERDRYTEDELRYLSITGYQKDGQFASSLDTYRTLKKIFGDRVDRDKPLMEEIISVCAIYSDPKMRKKRLAQLGLTKSEINAVSAKDFNGWSRLSKEFLTQMRVCAVDGEYVGEYKTVMDLLRETSMTLTEIVNSKDFPFDEEIRRLNGGYRDDARVTYEDVEALYCSPSVKRGIWQSLKVTDELIGAMKGMPAKIFVEVTRHEGKKQRTDDRKKKLLATYDELLKDKTGQDSGFKDRLTALKSDLERQTDEILRKDRVFLYFMQLGKCLYSGEPIELSEILDKYETEKAKSYDIDHIYPRALTKDDSVHRNKVLVKRQLNAGKKDRYPLDADIRERMTSYWKMLKDHKLIDPEKYERLTRSRPLEPEELEGFVARQLVFTDQSAKALIELLKRKYPATKIVYSKACNVTEFKKLGINDEDNAKRNRRPILPRELVKVRELNDLHHAKDAYLNVVVGNVYDVKYSRKYRYQNVYEDDGKKVKDEFNLNKLFYGTVKNGSKIAWQPDWGDKVYRQFTCNDCLVSRMQTTSHGGFYNQQRSVAQKDLQPIAKTEVNRYDPARYGGYKGVEVAFFTAFHCTVKKKREFHIDSFPVYLLGDYRKDGGVLKRYFEEKGYRDIEIVVPEIRKYALIEIDGKKLYLIGNSGGSLLFYNTRQLVLSNEDALSLRRMLRYEASVSAIKKKTSEQTIKLPSAELFKVSRQDNRKIFEEIFRKIADNPVLYRIVNSFKGVEDYYKRLDAYQQCKTVAELLKAAGCNGLTGNLSQYCDDKKMPANMGKIDASKNLTGKRVVLIDQSVTGLYERRRVLTQ